MSEISEGASAPVVPQSNEGLGVQGCDDFDCTICGGDGICDDNANPLWDCDDLPHPCHSCGGTGNRGDQRYM